MLFGRFLAWIDRHRSREDMRNMDAKHPKKDGKEQDRFSPMTYRNPYIMYMHQIISNVIRQKKISYQCLELIIIDAEENSDQDDQDVRMVLYDRDDQLNYLLIVTDRPERYESFMDEMYEENGLIVQQIQKTSCREVRGNVVLDFERSSSFFKQNAVHADAVYLPVYKRPWEIGENLDILVPVGYNTLIVEGILPADWQECRCMNERDRLDWEFRKG